MQEIPKCGVQWYREFREEGKDNYEIAVDSLKMINNEN